MNSQSSSWAYYLPQGMTLETIYIYAAATLVVIAMAVFGKSIMIPNATKVRIAYLVERRAELRNDYLGTKRRKNSGRIQTDENIEFMQKVVQKLNLIQANQKAEMTKLLVAAGYRSKNALTKYAFAQGVCAFGFMAFSLMFVKIDMADLGMSLLKICLPFISFYCGLYLPKILVVNQRDKRWYAIQKGLPDGLDLMMICTEAGLTLSAALDRVSKELGVAYPELAEELAITSIEIGFLPDRKKALENLGVRVGLAEMRALVAILIQTEKYGTPVSQALRVLAKEFRTQRMLRAEEKAARLPPMMTVPMILFILPCLFIIVISPAAIGLMGR